MVQNYKWVHLFSKLNFPYSFITYNFMFFWGYLSRSIWKKWGNLFMINIPSHWLSNTRCVLMEWNIWSLFCISSKDCMLNADNLFLQLKHFQVPGMLLRNAFNYCQTQGKVRKIKFAFISISGIRWFVVEGFQCEGIPEILWGHALRKVRDPSLDIQSQLWIFLTCRVS